MKIGNKRVLYSSTLLIPKGESASGEIFLATAAPPPSHVISGTDTAIVAALNPELIAVEISPEYDPKEEDKNHVKWDFASEPKPSLKIRIFGPFSSLASSLTQFSEFAAMNGKKVGFYLSFFGGPHLCTVHLQIMSEE